ncbi:MAG: winged helix-turn-helix transcriptional regulator [Pseudonocardia sp.]
MRHAELSEENCAIARASAVLGQRWVWPILRSAFNGARRFEDYQRGTGVARNILTDRLAGLVEHGILDKSPRDGVPRGHREYRLTEKGRALFPVYLALMQWGNEWTGLAAPPIDVVHEPCGHRTTPTVVCSECGEALVARETRPVLGAGHQQGGPGLSVI